MQPLPVFYTRSEIKRFIYLANMNQPHWRPGQAVCNKYIVPKVLEDQIWEMKDFQAVVQALFDYNNTL